MQNKKAKVFLLNICIYIIKIIVDCVFGQLTRSRNERKSKCNKCVLNARYELKYL